MNRPAFFVGPDVALNGPLLAGQPEAAYKDASAEQPRDDRLLVERICVRASNRELKGSNAEVDLRNAGPDIASCVESDLLTSGRGATAEGMLALELVIPDFVGLQDGEIEKLMIPDRALRGCFCG